MRPKILIYALLVTFIALSACSSGDNQSEYTSPNNEKAEESNNHMQENNDVKEPNENSDSNANENSDEDNDSSRYEGPGEMDPPGEMEFPEYEPPGEMEFPEYEPPNVPDWPDVDLENVNVEEDGDEVTLEVPDPLLFDFDKSELKSEAQQTLDEVATILEEYDGADVEINGHTDSTGDEEYNMDLSKERATSVEEYLDDQGALEEINLETEGYGDTEPIASNDDEEGQQKNRRVEIVIDIPDE